MDNLTPVYGTTADGHTAARVGDTTYCMLPLQNGGYRVAMVYRTKPGFADLTEASFYGFEKLVGSKEEFRAEMEDRALHLRQWRELGRPSLASEARTPWGKSQGMTVIAEDGIYKHHTEGHGGYKVLAKFNREIPEPYRNEDGWYEEDREWAKVAVSLPDFFTDREVRKAEETVRHCYPDEYEAVTGTVIPEGQSYLKDERLFRERHRDDWVVISASADKDAHGNSIVKCVATKGGLRSNVSLLGVTAAGEAEFIVPADEYNPGKFGFVIDPDRHERIDVATPSAGM